MFLFQDLQGFQNLAGFCSMQGNLIKYKGSGGGENDTVNYPVPDDVDNLLFFIQKNANTNTVVYQANIKENGELNKNDPINVFWKRYKKKDGKKAELGFMEKKFAYGIEAQRSNKKKGAYELELVSYDDRKMYMYKNNKGQYVVTTRIDGVDAQLERIFLNIKKGTLSFPEVKYIGLYGKHFLTGSEVYEKVEQ
ncbi:MAG: DUF4833 domain-containing protein [Flavobacteriales bacterium]